MDTPNPLSPSRSFLGRIFSGKQQAKSIPLGYVELSDTIEDSLGDQPSIFKDMRSPTGKSRKITETQRITQFRTVMEELEAMHEFYIRPEPQASNYIRTSKYTLLSFLPLNLFHQLCKPANLFFLVVCFLQCIKPISISNGSPTNLPPLCFVIAVSMVKDLLEDLVRQKSDKTENSSMTQLETRQDKKWGQLGLGHMIVVRENEQFPADIVII